MQRKYTEVQWKRLVTRLKSELSYYKDKVEELEQKEGTEQQLAAKLKEAHQEIEQLQVKFETYKEEVERLKTAKVAPNGERAEKEFDFVNEHLSNMKSEGKRKEKQRGADSWFFDSIQPRMKR
ncbi:hypothetical protein LC040_01575 [Bacillus tianshenii]|nr:hypothetical protein LC040_01575 [Bacillus tianshenii]